MCRTQDRIPALACDYRSQRSPPAHIQRSNPLGAIKLMRAQRHKIDIQSVNIQRQISSRLNCIRMKRDPASPAHCTDFSNRVDSADFVVGINYRNHRGIIRQRSGNGLWVDLPVRIDGSSSTSTVQAGEL